MARSNKCASIASRCATKASDARYNCIAPMVSKSTPSNSPKALRSRSQAWVARSEAGYASRATTEATAAVHNDVLMPRVDSNSIKPNRSAAHSPTCSTPTLRGRVHASDATSTGTGARTASASPARPRASSCATIRCASSSTTAGVSSMIGAWPFKLSSMRRHSSGHASLGRSKSLPRLSSVRWRTLSPSRSLCTRR